MQVMPEDKYDRYDENFIGNLLSDQNIYALKHINSFHNITTKLDENALRYAYKTGDFVTIGLHLLDKQFFNGESDGLVNVKDQRLIEKYIDVHSMNISSSHNVTHSKNFTRVLDRINYTINKNK